MEHAKATTAVDTLRKTLTEIGWEPEANEDNTSFFVDFGEPHLPVADALAAITPETHRFVFYVNLGLAAPPERRDEVSQFITLANWGLTIGNFEMDYNDGHARFKSSVDFSGIELTESLIRNAILSAMNAVEVYAGALIEVISGRKNALTAINDVESL